MPVSGRPGLRLAFLRGVVADAARSCADEAQGGMALRVSKVVYWVVQGIMGAGSKISIIVAPCTTVLLLIPNDLSAFDFNGKKQ